MTKGFLVAAAIAGGLLLAPLAPRPAAAVPLVKADMKVDLAKSGNATQVRDGRGGGHGGMRGGGGGHRSFGGGGGGMKSFGGGGRHRSFGGGGRHRSFGGGGRSRSFGVYGGGPKSFRRYGHRAHGARRFHRRRGSYYLPYVPYYYDDYGYGDDCEWLHLKALRTDSAYWWRRYEACINGY
jgi:hypothetical protein